MKEKIIEYLEQNRGSYISGEQLATELSISRTAVWKAIKKLQEEGFGIEAVTNKGYMLSEDTDVLSKSGIEAYLTTDRVRIEVVKTINSTNLAVKARADEAEGLVIAATEQTGGMGRLGRSFYSPSDTGIYFSILLKPAIDNNEVSMLTTIAALSVCEAIEKYSDVKPRIKWVNDVFVDGRKVSGTLTQASFSMENFGVEHVVVGIGINIYKPKEGFGKDLKNIAGAVFDERKGNIKNKILAETLNRFFYYYDSFMDKSFIEGYRERSMLIGKKIKVVSTQNITASNEADNSRPATAVAIDDMCHLVVRYEDGTEEALSTGEVSIRL